MAMSVGKSGSDIDMQMAMVFVNSDSASQAKQQMDWLISSYKSNAAAGNTTLTRK